VTCFEKRSKTEYVPTRRGKPFPVTNTDAPKTRTNAVVSRGKGGAESSSVRWGPQAQQSEEREVSGTKGLEGEKKEREGPSKTQKIVQEIPFEEEENLQMRKKGGEESGAICLPSKEKIE